MRTHIRLMMALAAVALVFGTCSAYALEVGVYYWPDEATKYIKVEEDTSGAPDDDGWWYWSYTYTNVEWSEGIAEWGYDLPDGVEVEYLASPTNPADTSEYWTPITDGTYDVGWRANGPNAYLVTDVSSFWHSTDNFKLRSKNEPHSIYTGTAMGDDQGSIQGDISGPTPEPVTMALLALGLPLGLVARRRKEE